MSEEYNGVTVSEDEGTFRVKMRLTPVIIIVVVVCLTLVLLAGFGNCLLSRSVARSHALKCTETCVISPEPKECIQACRGVSEGVFKFTHGPADEGKDAKTDEQGTETGR